MFKRSCHERGDGQPLPIMTASAGHHAPRIMCALLHIRRTQSDPGAVFQSAPKKRSPNVAQQISPPRYSILLRNAIICNNACSEITAHRHGKKFMEKSNRKNK